MDFETFSMTGLGSLDVPDLGGEVGVLKVALAQLATERASIVMALKRWSHQRLHFDCPYHPTVRQLRTHVRRLTNHAETHPGPNYYDADAAALGALLGALEGL